MSSNKASIAVAVRLRPTTQEATIVPRPLGVETRGRLYRFPSAVIMGSDQQQAYDALAAPLVARLHEGYSTTLLAYGQTGSGKTHTMFGPPGALTEASLLQAGGAVPPLWGLLPRAILELLSLDVGQIHASAVEVYQDRAFDLLADRAPLTVGSRNPGLKQDARAAVSVLNSTSEKLHAVHPPGCRCGPCWKVSAHTVATFSLPPEL